MTELRHGERRNHEDLGPCKILLVDGRVGMLVAVGIDHYGRPVSVTDVDTVDERGWGAPRKKENGVTPEEKKKAIALRKQGISQHNVAKMLSMSRSTVAKITNGVAPPAKKGGRNQVLSEDDVLEVLEMLNKGWRYSVIARWIGCTEQCVADIRTGKRGVSRVAANR